MDKDKAKLIAVTLIRDVGKSAVVEWRVHGQPQRATLPGDKIVDGKVDQLLLEAAPAYGVPWRQVELVPVPSELLEAALYDAGIWTDLDLRTNPQVVIGVLQALFGVHLGALAEFAAKYKA